MVYLITHSTALITALRITWRKVEIWWKIGNSGEGGGEGKFLLKFSLENPEVKM